MSLWSKTTAAVNKGWGMKPFSVHPPAVHPEYLMKGPYGTPPFSKQRGGKIIGRGSTPYWDLAHILDAEVPVMEGIDKNLGYLRDLNAAALKMGKSNASSAKKMAKKMPTVIEEGEEVTEGGKIADPLPYWYTRMRPAKNPMAERRARRYYPSTLRANFDRVRRLNKMRDLWNNQQIESETTFFDKDAGENDDEYPAI